MKQEMNIRYKRIGLHNGFVYIKRIEEDKRLRNKNKICLQNGWKVNIYVDIKLKSFEHNKKFLNYIINNKTSYI